MLQPWPEKMKDMQWHELKYNRLTLRYTLAYWGKQPSDGYPLYIGLHGGGGDQKDNFDMDNSAWNDMSNRYYYLPTKTMATADGGKSGAAYIACRGVSSMSSGSDDILKDEYNIHSRPESYVLYEHMIKSLISEKPPELQTKFREYEGTLDSNAKHFVNSNKVFLVGHSAGGDGVFNLAKGIPDLFAAVVASSGYACDANGSRGFFENFANLPLGLQVGERDDAYFNKDPLGRSERAKFYYNYNAALNQLEKETRPDGYPHQCSIMKEMNHSSWLVGLTEAGQNDKTYDIFTNLDDWYCDVMCSETKSRATTPTKMNEIAWVTEKGANGRRTTPRFVHWNLGQRPLRPDKLYDDTRWESKRFFYWLFDRKPQTTKDAGHTVRIRWEKSTDGNTHIYLDDMHDWLGVLLREPMIEFGKKVIVHWRNWFDQELTITPNETIKQQTLEARGDAAMMFSAMIYFESNSNGWQVKVANSLEDGGGEKLQGSLVRDQRIGGQLAQDQSLMPGDTIWSPNLEYHLLYRQDGNLVLVKGTKHANNEREWWTSEDVWQSKTGYTTPGAVLMQGDGGLVVTYNGNVRKSITEMSIVPKAEKGWSLVVQDGGRIVVSLNGAEKWDNIKGKLG